MAENVKIIKNLMTIEQVSKMDISELLDDMKLVLNRQAQCLVLAYAEIDGMVPEFAKELLSLSSSMNDRLAMDITSLDVKLNTRNASLEEMDILNESRK